MNNKRRFIAIALACAMLAGTALTTAAIPGSDTPFGITVSAADIVESGECGDNLTYTLDSEGTLTITGTGEMDDYEWRESPFYSNSDIKKVIIEDGVTTIGDCAFYRCETLTDITIPGSVTSIGHNAFEECSSLADVNFSEGLTVIKQLAFEGCTSITSITIPDGVITIERGAFVGCKSLTDVTIPDSVTSIGDNAFEGCTSLEGITIPESVKDIGDSAFGYYEDTENYNYVKLPGFTIKGYNGSGAERYANYNEFEFISLGDPDITESGKCGENLTYNLDSDGTLTISGTGEMYDYYEGQTICYYTGAVKNILIEDGVTSIGAEAFRYYDSLTSVTFPDSLTSIADYAFFGCEALTSITIPESVTYIGDSALGYKKDYNVLPGFTISGYTGSEAEYYANYNEIEFISLGEAKKRCGENVTYTLDSEGTLTISGSGALDEGYFGFGGSFGDNSVIKKVIIEDGVTSIGNSLFLECNELKSVTLPDSIKSIGDNAFSGCDVLESINVPDNVKSIGESAFHCCHALKSIELPDGLSSIGKDAFCECASLTDINIPGRVTTIEDSTFDGCESLTSIIIPDSVKSIGACAFRWCKSLTSVIIPESVTTIGEYAFENCFELEAITGYRDTEAERYAKDNGFKFIPLDEYVVVRGDVNGDGNADIADALLVARADAGLAVLTDAQKQAADVNGDGSADIADALMIARFDAQLITKLG